MKVTQHTKQILVIDRDDRHKAVYADTLKSLGLSFDHVSDREDALQRARTSHYEVIIADCALGEIQDTQFLKRILDYQPAGHAMVVSTCEGSVEDALQLFQHGVQDLIRVPLTGQQLASSLKRAFERSARPEGQAGRFLANSSSEYRLSSRELAECEFVPPILGELHRAGLCTAAERQRLEVAFQEAITNSADHGNLELESRWREQIDAQGQDRYSREKSKRLQDPHFAERELIIRTEWLGGYLTVTIQDQGRGFLNGVKQLSRTADDPLCHGRGISLIGHAVDELRYEDNGRLITMRKLLGESTQGN
jgi:CheY-like chemotaxis protein/anti-sigma regulatory factor (Ser/Thr protein kinase)